jgi:hypothetical protein
VYIVTKVLHGRFHRNENARTQVICHRIFGRRNEKSCV